jgi:hypothetical protein
MILKAPVMAVAPHAQASGDGATANSTDSADQLLLGIFPDQLGKKRLKLYDSRQKFGRQCRHNEDSHGKEIFRSIRGLPLLFQRS